MFDVIVSEQVHVGVRAKHRDGQRRAAALGPRPGGGALASLRLGLGECRGGGGPSLPRTAPPFHHSL